MRYELCNRLAEFDLVAAKVREEFFAWEKAANRQNVGPTAPSAATPPNASAKTMVGCRAREAIQNYSFM
jgi:hypothetical protein